MTATEARKKISPACGNDEVFEAYWASTAVAKLGDDNQYKNFMKEAAWAAFSAACRMMCEEMSKEEEYTPFRMAEETEK